MFIPGLDEGAVGPSGEIAGALLTGYQTRLNTFLSDLNSEGYTPVLFHTASSDPTTITALVADPVVATQRRRLRK